MCDQAESGYGIGSCIYKTCTGERIYLDKGCQGMFHCGCRAVEGQDRCHDPLWWQCNRSAGADTKVCGIIQCGRQF